MSKLHQYYHHSPSYVSIVAISLVALLLRLDDLSGNLYADEVWIITAVASPFDYFVNEFMEDWVHPPLFFIIVRALGSLFGFSDLSGRLVALTFGVLSVPLIYWVGILASNRRVATIAASLLALSPMHIFQSQYGRHYSLFVFFTLLLMAAFLELRQKPRSQRNNILYIVSSVLLVYTHYFGWVVLFCQNVFFLLFRFMPFRQWMVLQALVCIVYVPWLATVIPIALNSPPSGPIIPHIGWMSPPSVWTVISTLIEFNGGHPFRYAGKFGLLLLTGLSILPLRSLYQRDLYWQSIAFFFISIILPFGLIFGLSHIWQPMWVPRAMMLSLPAYYLLVTLGVEKISRSRSFRNVSYFPLLWMAVVSLLYLNHTPRMPYEEVATFLENNSTHGTPILVANTYLMNPIFFYYKGEGILYQLSDHHTSVVPESRKSSLSEILSNAETYTDRLILVFKSEKRAVEIRHRLSSQYKPVMEESFPGQGENWLSNTKTVRVVIFNKLNDPTARGGETFEKLVMSTD